MREALKYVWSYIRKYAGRFFLALFFTVLVAGLSMVSPFVTGKIVGEVINQGLIERLMQYLWIMLGAAVVLMLLRQKHVTLNPSYTEN